MNEAVRIFEYPVTERHDGVTLKEFLISLGFSREIRCFIKNTGAATVGGKKLIATDKLSAGDILRIELRESWEAVPNAELDIKTVYEDEDVIVYDKPPYVPVHQSMYHESDTLANYFAAFHENSVFRAVSRLDRNTSGLVLVAKNKIAGSFLMCNTAFSPKKLYYAIAQGNAAERYGEKGEITAPIAREDLSVIKRVVRDDGQKAHTKFRILRSNERYSLLELSLVTGRTHQIRVHLSYAGFPLYGDDLYGGSTAYIGRQALHCGKLWFVHPITGNPLSFSSGLPQDMLDLMRSLDSKSINL